MPTTNVMASKTKATRKTNANRRAKVAASHENEPLPPARAAAQAQREAELVKLVEMLGAAKITKTGRRS